MVSINNIFGDGGEIPGVSCDYFRTGFLAARHLLEKNHRQVVYMTNTCRHPESHFYFSGFRAGFEAAGIKLTEQNILETKANIQLFNRRIMEFFKDGSHTACFVRSVSFIPRMLTVLKRNGIRVPEDLSLIAGGDYGGTAPGKLKVTTIDNRLDLMCRIGLEKLQKIIQGRRNGDNEVTLLEPCLKDRGSCRNLDADLK
jgi:LacI family transcriptional regulator